MTHYFSPGLPDQLQLAKYLVPESLENKAKKVGEWVGGEAYTGRDVGLLLQGKCSPHTSY